MLHDYMKCHTFFLELAYGKITELLKIGHILSFSIYQEMF